MNTTPAAAPGLQIVGYGVEDPQFDMAVRDMFAARLITIDQFGDRKEFANSSRLAFEVADAMMIARGTPSADATTIATLTAERDALRAAAAESVTQVAALTAERDALMIRAKRLGFAYMRRTIAMQAAAFDSVNGSLSSGADWIISDLKRTDQLPAFREVTALGGVRDWFKTKLAVLDAAEAAQPAPAGEPS